MPKSGSVTICAASGQNGAITRLIWPSGMNFAAISETSQSGSQPRSRSNDASSIPPHARRPSSLSNQSPHGIEPNLCTRCMRRKNGSGRVLVNLPCVKTPGRARTYLVRHLPSDWRTCGYALLREPPARVHENEPPSPQQSVTGFPKDQRPRPAWARIGQLRPRTSSRFPSGGYADLDDRPCIAKK